ncbi:MAG TPA: serine/threonine-protein kinase [Pirellulales bacterium]|nr:serine/threonine-protein kinase [Pirellulales bacterium]
MQNENLERLKRQLFDSELLSESRFDEIVAACPPAVAENAAELLAWLRTQGWLGEFQLEALAAGVSGPFRLGPYRVDERIAAGRLGSVFRAVHVDFDQAVSLKIFSAALADDPTQLARMQREVRIAAQLEHPHVVRSFHVGRAGKAFFLAFEDLAGESLQSRIERQGRLPYAEACRLVRHAALALEHLHEAEIIHRDLRPANLWIDGQEQLKVIDFGAARDALAFLDHTDGDRELTRQGTLLGDYAYSAPEAAFDARKADWRSDVYALGCVLYQALAGQPPFVHKNPMKVAQAHALETPRPLSLLAPDVPAALEDLARRLLAKEPDQRPTVAEVDWNLQRYVADSDLAMPAARQTWNPAYLAWIEELNAGQPLEIEPAARTGLSEDMTDFLDWLATMKG